MFVFGVILVRILLRASEYGRVRTRMVPNADTFHAVLYPVLIFFLTREQGGALDKPFWYIKLFPLVSMDVSSILF